MRPQVCGKIRVQAGWVKERKIVERDGFRNVRDKSSPGH